MTNCILWQNDDQTITLIDVPRSIEEAQGYNGINPERKIVSSRLLTAPYPSTEPKSAKALNAAPEPPLEDLLIQRHLQISLDVLKSVPGIVWALPRHIAVTDEAIISSPGTKRRLEDDADIPTSASQQPSQALDLNLDMYSTEVFHNPKLTIESTYSTFGPGTSYIPPLSSFILGNLESSLDTFSVGAPKFDVVVMDPPWPNRSARRKRAYGTERDGMEIHQLLQTIPLRDHLNEGALVGVWVTNRAAFKDALLESQGLFDQWDVQLVEEWAWLKITSSGEPMSAIDGTWRKPYEVLLLGKRRHAGSAFPTEIKRRVIVAVADLHSRKPNVKSLLEPLLPKQYRGLEVFARNLTAGWWAWGNEVLKFQHESNWATQRMSPIL